MVYTLYDMFYTSGNVSIHIYTHDIHMIYTCYTMLYMWYSNFCKRYTSDMHGCKRAIPQ